MKFSNRLPLTVIMTVLLQLATALTWATQLDARMDSVEDQLDNNRGLSEKFARLDERLDHMREDIVGIRRQLDHLTDRLLGQ